MHRRTCGSSRVPGASARNGAWLISHRVYAGPAGPVRCGSHPGDAGCAVRRAQSAAGDPGATAGRAAAGGDNLRTTIRRTPAPDCEIRHNTPRRPPTRRAEDHEGNREDPHPHPHPRPADRPCPCDPHHRPGEPCSTATALARTHPATIKSMEAMITHLTPRLRRSRQGRSRREAQPCRPAYRC